MSGPTNYDSQGLEMFTEQRPAIVQLADLLDYINEMRDLYNETQQALQEAQSYHYFTSVKEFGAKGDGVTDDTKSIQDALNVTGNVWIPNGVYMINALTKLRVWSNTNIHFSSGAIFKVISNSAENYRVFDLLSSENVTINNPTLIGDRKTHSGTTGEYGHGIVLSSAKNIKIYNAVLNDFWGDAIAVYGGENCEFKNIFCDNNRRQGISIIRCKNLTIDGALIKNTNGTNPQCGIDVEPNTINDYIDGLRLLNITTEGNASAGISLILDQLNSDVKPISIQIENHVDENSNYGFVVGKMSPSSPISGEITNINAKYYNSKSSGIYVTGYVRENTPTLKIIDPVIINPNTLNVPTSFPQDGSGITIFRATSIGGTKKIGNIIIERPIIKDLRSTKQMIYGLYIKDQLNIGFDNFYIKDPIIETDLLKKARIDEKINVFDQYKTFLQDSTSQYLSLSNILISSFLNNGSTVATQVNIAPTFKASVSVDFTNVGSNGFLIIPPANCNIIPLSQIAGKYIQTSQIGASITLKKINDTNFLIEKMTGNWTIQP